MSEAIVFRMDAAEQTKLLVYSGDRKVLYRVKNLGTGKLLINEKIDLMWCETVDVWVSELKVKSVSLPGASGQYLGSYQFISA
jgi:hypothetical protein